MKTEVWALGKTSEPYLETGIALYEKRLRHYLPFQWVAFPSPKSKSIDPAAVKQEEARLILQKLQPDDFLVLLDERGDQLSSTELANWLQQQMNQSTKKMVFLIGGAYGFTPELYLRANRQLSLSKMTFSHQMFRIFLLEQLYRAMTILRNEPYHNP